MKLITEDERVRLADMLNQATVKTFVTMEGLTDEQQRFACQIAAVCTANMLFVLQRIEIAAPTDYRLRN